MSSTEPEDHKWTDAIEKRQSKGPLDPKVTQLIQKWITGNLTNQHVFGAIETLSEELVPANDGDTFSLECYQRTLLRVRELMALQQAVLFCIEASISTPEGRNRELQQMLNVANGLVPNEQQLSSWDRYFRSSTADWISGKLTGREIILQMGMFVDGALSSSLLLGSPRDQMRESHQCSIRNGIRAATLQFAAQKAEADGITTAAAKSQLLDSLTVDEPGRGRSQIVL